MRYLLLICFISIVANCYSQIKEPKAKQKFVIEAKESLVELDLSTIDFSDLEFLKKELQGKRIVYLGESNHHTETQNKIKLKLIRFLNSEMGFNVLAFESNISSCLHANMIKDQVDPFYLLTHSILGCWRTESNIELMKFIQSSGINLTGFDPNQNANIQDRIYYQSIFTEDTVFANYLYQLDSIYLHYNIRRVKYLRSKTFDKQNEIILDSLKTYLTKSYSKLKSNLLFKPYKYRDELIHFLRLSIKNKLATLKTCNQLNEHFTKQYVTNNYREQLMQDNLEFLLDTLFPTEKVIVWAHNGHISKGGTSTHIAVSKNNSLGYRLDAKYKSESYTIGLYGYPGTIGKGYLNETEKLPLPKKNSLESVLFLTNEDLFFIKTNIQAFHKPVYNFGEGNVQSISNISDCYDAVIFARNLEPSILINKYDHELNE